MAWWTDERIKINSSHFFWDTNNHKKGISLKGKFVQDCLWTPKLSLWGLDELATWKPSAESSEGSPLSFHLFSNGLVAETMENVRLLIECGMKFDYYPFDVQVYFFIFLLVP